MSIGEILLLLWRGLRLRCPNCGKGRLFRGVYATYERCSHCGWVFEREEGYWTGAMAVNLVISELIIAAFALPFSFILAENHGPITLFVIIGLAVSVALPFLLYRHSKSLWMSLDFILHPADWGRPVP
jgi:uncharacterized protein (DUF983 family)